MAKSSFSAMYEELGSMLQTQPFAPFDIKTTDGDTIHVWNPDYAIRSPAGDSAIIYDKDGHFRIINLKQVVTFEPSRPKKGMLGQGGGKK